MRPSVLPRRRPAFLAALLLALLAGVPVWAAKKPSPWPAATYSMADFARIPKIDAHVHVNVDHPAFLQQARADGFGLLSINVDYPDFPPIADQRRIAQAQGRQSPARFWWAATFSMQDFGSAGWVDAVNTDLAKAVGEGARAVKIWKNVGMAEKDAQGRLIMLDDPGFNPIVAQIRRLGVPLIGHQGEPHNCWLPLEQMTNDNDREYFKAHPQYHMALHPDQPSYEDQMGARDRFLAAHPGLRFVGAHLASLEFDVDRIAALLDAHPEATVDMAARMTALQVQSVRDRKKVRDFFLKYQDRILYATDLTFGADADPAAFRRDAHQVWRADWRYLATPLSQRVDQIHADVPGLALPRGVIDKIYRRNAQRVFGAPRR